jgi:hypothetical protein
MSEHQDYTATNKWLAAIERAAETLSAEDPQVVDSKLGRAEIWRLGSRCEHQPPGFVVGGSYSAPEKPV